jgi:hypothetical protein
MTTNWALSTVGLYVTTVGALLILLYLCDSPRSPDAWQSPDGKLAYARHRRLLIVAVGLLAAWLVIQDLATIML